MAKKTLHTFWKNPNVEKDNYKSQFDAYVTVLEACVGGISVPPDLVDENLRELYPLLGNLKNELSNQIEAATEAAKDQYLACVILVGSNNAKFGELKDDLSNSYLLRDDQYPKNREGLIRLLKKFKGSKKQPTTTNTTTAQYGVVFIKKYSDSDNNNGKRVNTADE